MSIPVRVIAFTLVACLGIALSAAPAPAGDVPASSNQSATIETSAPPSDPPDSLSAEFGSGRTIRRKPAALGGVLDADRTESWYRTGLGATGIVLGLVAIAFLGLRRWVPSVRAPDNGVLKVLGRAGLTPKHNLALVQFGRRFVLVGISPDRVELVSEVIDPGEAAELSARIGVGLPAGANAFDELLTREASEFVPVREPTRAEQRAPMRDLLHRLKALRSQGL